MKYVLFALIALSLVSAPVAAQNPAGFLCDKTADSGETLTKGEDGYENTEFAPITQLLRTIAWLVLIGIPVACAAVAVYATVADLLFTPSGEDANVTQYVQMRTGAVFAGVMTPIGVLLLDFGLDVILPYYVTCIIPTPL